MPSSGPPATAPESSPHGHVAIAATFTADDVVAPLALMLEVAGIALSPSIAPYHQVFQQLLTPGSELANNAGGVGVVLVRLEDFVRDVEPDRMAMRARDIVDELIDAARQFVRRSVAPCVFVVLDVSPSAPVPLRDLLEDGTRRLRAELGSLAGCLLIGSAAIDALCDGERHDPTADRMAHIPYTDVYFAALAIALARTVHTLKVPAHKVLVLDCDNTIWRGVVGEDGVDGIGLEPEFLGVQRFAVEAQAEGALVCLASKNTEADVLEVLAVRTDMVLRHEHIVSHRINWEAKASNLRSLARELNLGLDSFVFVDDNPVECGQMREALPEVVTLQLPPPGSIGGFLRHLWVFDKASVTQEDARRTAMYRENAARDDLEAQADDIGAFVAALELKIDIGAPAEDEWARVAQLTQRTNQFNFTTTRRSEADMRALGSGGATVLAVRVSDRFGDYGLVGVVVARTTEASIDVDTFLLSCRVLGRGVEHAILSALGTRAADAGLPLVRLPFLRTSKNEPARAFADATVGAYRVADEADAARFDYAIPAAVAAGIRHRPGEDAAEVIEARKNDAKKPGRSTPAVAGGRAERYSRLATELISGSAVLAALRRASTRDRDLAAPLAVAENDDEARLLVLWESILGLRGLGVEDDYFALGGTSLQAARLFAELNRQFGVQLPLTTILESPTVRRLAARLHEAARADAGHALIRLRGGGTSNLFLVHDGDGETLLYRNLAYRLPAEINVYGIQPTRLKGVPLAHLRIEDMAAAYIGEMRRVQPVGPYLLGGMCAGGLIAYEIAVQLERAGETVAGVLVMDSATPDAERNAFDLIAYRKSRLREALADARGHRSLMAAVPRMAGSAVRKVWGVMAFRVRSWWTRGSTNLRFALLGHVLAHRRAWPTWLPSLGFRAIYDRIEQVYRPGAVRAPVLLVRARSGSGNDTGYQHLYRDPTLGWGRFASVLELADVEGGHASMLQEPHVASLTEVVRPHLVVFPVSRSPRPAKVVEHEPAGA